MTKKNLEAFAMLTDGNYSMLDMFIKEIKLFYENHLSCIKISFSKHYEDSLAFEVTLKDIVELLYYADNGNIMGYVERLKFFRTDNENYYLSLDPYDKDEWAYKISEEDACYFMSKELELRIFEH